MTMRTEAEAKLAALAERVAAANPLAARLQAVNKRTGRRFGTAVSSGQFIPTEMVGQRYVWRGKPVRRLEDAIAQIEEYAAA